MRAIADRRLPIVDQRIADRRSPIDGLPIADPIDDRQSTIR
jgi:hypothetical protein